MSSACRSLIWCGSSASMSRSASFLLLTFRRPRSATLFPYTTLFRSEKKRDGNQAPGRISGSRPFPRQSSPGRGYTADLKPPRRTQKFRSEEHTSELQSLTNLVCRLLLEKKKYDVVNVLSVPQLNLVRKLGFDE